ncbi:DsbA family protein [Pseudooceanicola sp. LIPI14-2-Ac024]|uniref:DsbA family protein n=1 Tax=Pseudooceanicola sp. LIPI14-2-Ac024 TaxID=3344875 RepID=UPI0035CEF06D
MTATDTDRKGAWTRRAVVLGLIAAPVAAFQLAPRLAGRFGGSHDFEPLAHPEGFRRLRDAAPITAPGPLAGLDEAEGAVYRIAPGDLCTALFEGAPPPGTVPIASFTDYNCPYCRVLTGKLAALAEREADTIRMAWHEWPLLGPTSEIAARAALAAKMQGAYTAFHERLMQTRFVPTPAYLGIVAQDIGIDPDRMIADMDSAEVDTQLARTAALAREFGFAGTPALVIGRTVVVGNVTEGTVAALVRQELRDGPVPACA